MSNNLAISLNDKQESFVRDVCNGIPPAIAAERAGYSSAQSALRNPAVVVSIRQEITKRLTVEALPVAFNVLLEIAKGIDVPPAVRRAAARDLIDRAGLVPPKAGESLSNQTDKPLSEMTSDELRALVDRLESELMARAIDVTPAADQTNNAQKSAVKQITGLDFLN